MPGTESSHVAEGLDWSPEAATAAPRGRRPFGRHHGGDRNFFLTYVALIWAAILLGFGPQIVKHIRTDAPPYPLIVHLHAVAFVGWLLLLTTQVLLIRWRRADVHRTMGLISIALAAAMVALGPITAVIVDRHRLTLPNPDPGFLVVQLSDILAFAGLVIPAFLWRGNASVHKRMILLATLYITDAGFARWLADPIEAWVGDGYWSQLVQLYGGSDLLILGIGLYDLVTRKRLHPAYVISLGWVAAVELTAIATYMNPRWAYFARQLLGS